MARETRRDGDVIWVYWRDLRGQRLIERRELQPWIEALIDKVGPDGGVLGAVNFVFSDRACAAYNHDNLAFARVGVYMDGEPPERYEASGGTPSFDIREDGGIPSD